MATKDELLAAFKIAFPDLTDIVHKATAGQKKVFQAKIGDSTLALKAITIGKAAEPVDAPEDPETAEQVSSTSARLEREIAILRTCNCVNIVRLSAPELTEISVADEIYAVYGEEWVDGEDLARLFRQRRIERAEAIELGLALCSALAELDAHGYIHRDVKPANIMRRSDGVFILVDPGLALDRSGPSLSVTGAVPGTAPYISPEQWDPTRKRDLDVRSDMFAVGAVLFEGLTGHHPFYQTGMSQLEIMTTTRSKSPRALERDDMPEDDPLRDIVSRLLAKNPHGRYRDTKALREAFEAAR